MLIGHQTVKNAKPCEITHWRKSGQGDPGLLLMGL